MKPQIDESPIAVLREPDDDALRRQFGRGAVVVLSSNPSAVIDIARGVDGPWGLLPIDVDADTLRAALDAVGAGLIVLAPSMTASALVPGPVRRAGQRSSLAAIEVLTPRELDVLQRLAEGLPNRAIADALGISDHTVKFHLASVFGKLGATTRTEAARIGLRQGLVTV